MASRNILLRLIKMPIKKRSRLEPVTEQTREKG